MTNMDNKINNKKAFFVVLCVFAVIGVIAVLGGAVFLGMKIAEKRIENAQSSVVEVELASSSEDVNDIILQDAGAPLNKNQQQGELSQAEVPEVEPQVVVDDTPFGNDRLQIVYMGDSIFDFHREDGTSVPKLASDLLNANYINLAMGGTTASIDISDHWENENWTSTSGAGVAKAMAGLVNPDVLLDCSAKELVKSHINEFSETDIFVIEYGINDFLMNRRLDDMDNLGNPTTYQGGLTQMLRACRSIAPQSYIIICKPSYCEFWGANGDYLGNTYVMYNDVGASLFDYGGKVDCVDDPDDGMWAFDTNVDNGINIYSNAEYLEDGIHLTEAGRYKYAEMLSQFIIGTVPGVKEYLGIESTEEE